MQNGSHWLLDPVITTIALFAGFLVVSVAGFWLGRLKRADTNESARAEIGMIEGAMLALVGLLLAFTVSMAEGRFDTRRKTVVEEANAIGTAALRAGLQPEPERSALKDLFIRYTDARIEYYKADLAESKQPDLSAKTGELQQKLWSQAASLAAKDPHSITAGLFIASLNDVIDVSEKQTVAFGAFIPDAVMNLLFFASMLVIAAVSYLNGLGTGRHFLLNSMLTTLIAMTLFVILDLDRPRRGLIRTNYQSMIRLKDSLAR